MKKYFYIGILVICCVINSSCKRKTQDSECVFKECECRDTMQVSDKFHFFPFDQGFTVVAYEYSAPMSAGKLDLIGVRHLDSTRILRADTLSEEEILQLEKICMNRVEKCNVYNCIEGTDCLYDPRHCIVFYGSEKQPMAYIEACFSCNDYQVWPADVFGPKCGDFMYDLHYFMTRLGFSGEQMYDDNYFGYAPDSTEIWKGFIQPVRLSE